MTRLPASPALTSSRGFTLMEMVVVLMIIAILLALAIPDQTPRTTRKQLQTAIEYADKLKPNVEAFYKNSALFPADNQAASLAKPEQLISGLIKRVDVVDGAIHITLGNNAHGVLQDQVLSLQPVTVTDNKESPMDWTCGFSKIPTGMEAHGENRTSIKPVYLPFECLGADKDNTVNK